MRTEEYQNRVWALFKPEIRDVTSKAELYLSGKMLNEAVELLEVASQKAGNPGRILDEAGDVLWYVANLAKVWYQELPEATVANIVTADHYLSLTINASNMYGAISKGHYHGKHIDYPRLTAVLGQIMTDLTQIVQCEGFTLEDVMKNNIAKLEARMGGGSYNPAFYKTPQLVS